MQTLTLLYADTVFMFLFGDGRFDNVMHNTPNFHIQPFSIFFKVHFFVFFNEQFCFVHSQRIFFRRRERCTDPPAASLPQWAVWIALELETAPNHDEDLVQKSLRSHGGPVLHLLIASYPHLSLLPTPFNTRASCTGNTKRKGKREAQIGVFLTSWLKWQCPDMISIYFFHDFPQ